MNVVTLEWVANLAVGGRPAGGPFVLTITDGARWKADAEYEIAVECREDGCVIFAQRMSPERWSASLAAAIRTNAVLGSR